MIRICPLAQVAFEDIYTAFTDAFHGYIRTWTKDELNNTLIRRAYAPELSFGAFDGNTLVSFILNGIGSFNGRVTAYDAGTGTVQAYQRQGLSSKVFEHTVPLLKLAGVSQYLLEVLTGNDRAISLYKKAGFDITRRFEAYILYAKDRNPITATAASPPGYEMMLTEQFDEAIAAAMCNFNPSWQNSFASIRRAASHLKTICVRRGNTIAGYGIIEPLTGDIPFFGIAHGHRRKGLGRVLLQQVMILNESDVIKFINVDAADLEMKAFLKKAQIPVKAEQYEMIKTI